jgi:predicted GH43/DUF377 family glycosyl hydrolase
MVHFIFFLLFLYYLLSAANAITNTTTTCSYYYDQCEGDLLSVTLRAKRLAEKQERIGLCSFQSKLNRDRVQYVQSIDKGEYLTNIYLLHNVLLPTMSKWKGNQIFVCWRAGFKTGKIKYGWLPNLPQLHTSHRSASDSTSSLISSAWNISTSKSSSVMSSNSPRKLTSITSHLVELGIVPEAPRYSTMQYKFIKQEEPRILVLSSGKLVLIYAGNTIGYSATQHLAYVYFDIVEHKVIFNRTVLLLKYPGKQKNWIPFETITTNNNNNKQQQQQQLLFVQQFNPLHIIKIGDSIFSDRLAVNMETVSKLPEMILPWKSELFGKHIRGGTQALLVRGVYLSFFHTCIENPPKQLIKSYFMGAITFNSSFPYNLISMSEVPILTPALYSGRWVWDGLDYVLYPTGLVIDEKEEYLYVSAGWQDVDAVVMKMHIDTLFKSFVKI